MLLKYFFVQPVHGMRLACVPTVTSLCTTIHRYPIFSTRYSVTCKVYLEHGLCACTVDNLHGDYLSIQTHKPCSISHMSKPSQRRLTLTLCKAISSTAFFLISIFRIHVQICQYSPPFRVDTLSDLCRDFGHTHTLINKQINK